MGYVCSVCNQEHEGPPYAWAPSAPDAWTQLDEYSRDSRGEISTDQCVIDGEHFFVIGRLEIPVQDQSEMFAWLIWVEVKREDFYDMTEKWNQPGRESTSPYQGNLANQLSLYKANTLGLPAQVHTRKLGERPFIEVTGQHQLAIEQTDGISRIRVQKIAEILSH
jgi:hypothetical protein